MGKIAAFKIPFRDFLLVQNIIFGKCMYILLLYSCHISDGSGSSDMSDRRQEQTCLQDFSTVCFSNRHYVEFGGPWACAVSALVFPLYTISALLNYTRHLFALYQPDFDSITNIYTSWEVKN